MKRWDGRVALVTGASAGIGAELCKILVKYGINVVGCARNVAKIRALSQDEDVAISKGKIHAIKCNLAKESEIHAMFAEISLKYGHIDICINNAGFYIESAVLSGRPGDWEKMLKVNVSALGLVTREAVKLMGKNNAEGQVINITSLKDHLVYPGAPHFHVLCHTKILIKDLTLGLRGEIKSTKPHIRVTCISPGVASMAFIARSFYGPDTKNFMYKQVKSKAPKDIAGVVVNILESPKEMDITSVIVQAMDKRTIHYEINV